MELSLAIQSRQSVRAYTPARVPGETLRRLIAQALEAPSACNLQLTEYLIIDDGAKLTTLAEQVSGKFAWSPTYIVLLYDPRFTVKRGAALVSLGASAENLMLAAVAEGLATCPMAGFDADEKIKRILEVPEPYEIGLVLAIGYPTRNTRLRSRRPVDEVIHTNSLGDVARLKESPRLADWSVEELAAYRARIAPVYLYEGHESLHVYPREVYARAYETLASFQKAPFKETRVLDLMTYDGAFARELLAEVPDVHLSVSDIFAYPTAILAHEFPRVHEIEMSAGKLSAPAESIDGVTLVHKIEFTPLAGNLLQEVRRVLVSGGFLYITAERPSIRTRLRAARNIWKKRFVGRERVNVYENNPYYKIGPFGRHPDRRIRQLAESNGFKEVACALVPSVGTNRMFCALYRKV